MERIDSNLVRDFLVSIGFVEVFYNSGIYKFGEYHIHFIQRDWSVENWLTIELVQDKNKFLKFNGVVDSFDDFKLVIGLVINKNGYKRD